MQSTVERMREKVYYWTFTVLSIQCANETQQLKAVNRLQLCKTHEHMKIVQPMFLSRLKVSHVLQPIHSISQIFYNHFFRSFISRIFAGTSFRYTQVDFSAFTCKCLLQSMIGYYQTYYFIICQQLRNGQMCEFHFSVQSRLFLFSFFYFSLIYLSNTPPMDTFAVLHIYPRNAANVICIIYQHAGNPKYFYWVTAINLSIAHKTQHTFQKKCKSQRFCGLHAKTPNKYFT